MSPSASKSAPRARDSRSGQAGLLLAAISSAIGLGNIWCFPDVFYSNGGGAFLIPYLIALVSVGIPMLWLDYVVGHKFRGSSPWALRKIVDGGEFVGWFQTFVCFVIMIYYGAVLAWGVQYTIYSANEAWGADPTTFFLESFLEKVPGDTSSQAPAWAVMILLALVWVLVLFMVGRGLSKGVEAASKVFLPFLVILFLALIVRAPFLPGAVGGLNVFFTSDWSTLADPKVWLTAFAQIFYSLSVGFGIMLTYASYLKPKSNLTDTALVAGFANSSFKILAGIGVFSAIGFMARQGGVNVSEADGLTGPILSFVTFPKIISMMPDGPIFGMLFFSSLVLAGAISLLPLLQVVSGDLQDKFGWSPVYFVLVLGVPATVIPLALFGTRSGLNNLDIVDNLINSVGVVSSAIMSAVLCAVAGPRLGALRAHISSVSSVRIPKLWEPLVGIVIPVVLFVMMAMSLVKALRDGYEGYPSSYILIFGWGSVAVAVIVSLIFTFIPWKHRPVDTYTTVAQILADDAEDTVSIEGGAE